MNPFDLQNSPLTGTNLIEASAGTGKTYTLSGLFLRLILEKSLTVDRILVVTFTEAATDELKDRIRRKLREAITVFSEGYGDDDFLVGLLERQENPDKGLELLKAAIRDFDESAIFTIHSFCKRMLHEYAFESGSLFDTELLTDQEALRREIVEDFWRRHFYAASPLFVNYAVKNISPDKLRLLLRNTLPDIRIIPDTDIPDSGDQEEAYKSVFEAVSRAWLSAKSEVSEILLNDKGLNRSKYKASNILTWISDMDRVIGLGSDNPFLFEKFEKFTTSVLSESVKKNSVAPSHSFFDLCETLRLRQSELCAVFDLALIGLKIRLFQYAETELRRRKETQNIRFFDDLLLNL
ncbi:MAG TPA: exodeoxyribonuclease V subunit beta, partial [Desulfobacteraceae bacterium]|nr:exodeoxyribonuclease V subunit beta [Desulfobacteraceae bacterium]